MNDEGPQTFMCEVEAVVISRLLRGPPCKNETKMTFFRQGSKIEILSISAYK